MSYATVGQAGAPLALDFGPYGTIGGYTSGVWLVARNGQGAVVSHAHLPPEGSGFQYYWLGSSPEVAKARLLDALGKLNVGKAATDGLSMSNAVDAGFRGQIGTFPKLPHGILGAIKSALTNGVFVTGPLESPGPAATAEGAGAGAAAGEGAAGGAAAGKAASGAGTAIKAATAAAAGLSLTDSKLWVRVIEAVGGLLLLVLGIRAVLGGDSPVSVIGQTVRRHV